MEHLHSGLSITLEQYCDKGIKEENQDTLGARIPEGSALLTKGIAIAVADGVSSSSAAKQASQSAITGFLTDYYATPDTWRTQQSATRVIHSLNQYLWGQSRNSVREEGYLTTFSSLILKGDKAFLFHIGDTRIYRFRDGNLEQLTRDHAQKIDKKTTYLSRAMGADVSVEIDMHTEELQVGDIFLLSSDGIHDFIQHKDLVSIVQTAESMEAICEHLVKAANENYSNDNQSIQALSIDAIGTPSQQDAVTVLSQLPFPPPLNIGHKLDGLEVKKIMHESERSQVYLVEDKDKQRFVMKTPSENYSDDPAYIERFVMEAWIGSRIQNSNVVRVIQPQHERSFLYYLTEYIPGPTLAELIKERAPFAIPDAIDLLEEVIKGVRAFHRKDTLHQDIKPENIVLGKQGAVVIDFGSCFVGGIEEAGAPFQRDTILGTLRYSAPEYRCGTSISQRSDQFSLAVLVYEMLTNQVPFGDAYEKQNNSKGFQALKYIPARKYNPLVPVWMDYAIEKALNTHPNSRYSSLSEFTRDLKRPNPNWSSKKDIPLLESHPLRVWQILAAAGWALAFAQLIPWK